jgi:hypothetical protein
MIELDKDALVTGELRVRWQHVHQVPGHVARLGLGPETGQRVGGTVVVDDSDMGVHLHVGLMIGPHLALGVCAAPGHYGQRHRILRLRGAEGEHARHSACADQLQRVLFHISLLCLTMVVTNRPECLILRLTPMPTGSGAHVGRESRLVKAICRPAILVRSASADIPEPALRLTLGHQSGSRLINIQRPAILRRPAEPDGGAFFQ